MPQPQIPRWMVYTGWVMLAVGAVLLVRDIAASDSTLEGSIGGVGLVIDLAIDLFLIVAGLLVILAARRNARS